MAYTGRVAKGFVKQVHYQFDDKPMTPVSTVWNQLQQRTFSVAQIREVDRIAVERYRMSSLVLMENAAIGCAQWLVQRFTSSCDAVVLCGRGNNGGDGVAIARHLRVLGWSCRIAVLGPIDKLSSDARANLDILLAGGGKEVLLWNRGDATAESAEHQEKQELERAQFAQLQSWLASTKVVIDAMLGTGATGEPEEPLSMWIALANRSSAHRIAIDIPTGWNATTGEASQRTFKADATLTFVARKPAMDFSGASNFLGDLTVLPIGIPEELIKELLLAPNA